jgi:fibronectin type 3 domain-containing protein
MHFLSSGSQRLATIFSRQEKHGWTRPRVILSLFVLLAFVASLFVTTVVLPHLSHPNKAHAQSNGPTVKDARKFGIVDGGVDWVNVINGVTRINNPTNGNALTLDANGWPQADAQYILFDARKNMPWNGPDPNATNPMTSGNYSLSFTGQATISPDASNSPNAFTVSNQSYDSATNTTTATITILPNQLLVALDFTNTKRQPGDTAGDGITNIRLIAPGYPANTTQVFTNETIQAYSQGFSAVRSSGLGSPAGVGSNFCGTTLTTSEWADRVLVSQAFQGQSVTVQNNQICSDTSTPTGHQGYGIAWEYVVALANASNEDLWLTFPYNASDDYLTKLAELLKYGSDGVNPYTSPQSNPVWAPLNPNLNIYVEDSDEVWNFSYPEYVWNSATATNKVKAGGSDLNNDGSTDSATWAARNYAERTYEASNIFKNVYGASAINTTIRPVLDWQYDTEYASGPFGPGTDTVLEWLSATHGAPNQYLYGIGEAPYYDASDTSSVDAVINSLYTNSDANRARYIAWQALASYYGLKQVGYEAGPSLGTGNGGLASRDPRIAATEVHHFIDNWFAIGGDQVNFETLRGSVCPCGDWFLVENFANLNTPKNQGALTILNSPFPAITSGYLLPTSVGQTTSIDASQYGQSGKAPGSNLSLGGDSSAYPHPYAYLLRAPYAGTYTISLSGVQDNANEQANLSVDNTSLGAVQLPTTAGTSSSVSVNLSAGFHTLNIVYTYINGATSGNAHPQSINLGLSSGGGATVVPSAPGNPSIQTVADGSLTVQWPTTTDANSYTVLRSTVSGGPFSPIASNLTTNSYTDSGLTDGTTYYYVVQANNSAGSSANSPQIPGIPTHPSAPAAPTNVQVTYAHNGTISLSWTGSSDADGYRVWRSTTSGSGYKVIGDASDYGAAPQSGLAGEQTATTFTDGGQGPFGSDPTDGTTYYYVVTAVNSFGESPYSSEVSATPTDVKPDAPTGLTATAGDGEVSLSWTPPLGMRPQFSPPQYNVYRSTTAGGPYTQVIQTSVDNAIDFGLTNGTTYYYVVTANNPTGESPYSNEVSATPQGGNNLPSPWKDGDIGSVGQAGSASASNGTFTVKGSGADIWGGSDGFNYVYQPLNGDGEITAQVTGVQNTDPWAKAGVMIRETLDPGSTYAATEITPGNGARLQWRSTSGQNASDTAGPAVTAPYWVKLVRSGNTFTSLVSSDGQSWTTIGSTTITMANSVYIGLAVTAHNNGALNSSTFANVSVSTTGPNLVQNPGFETGDLSNWQVWVPSGQSTSNAFVEQGGHTGTYRLAEYNTTPFEVSVYQSFNNVTPGTYQASAWVEGNGGERMAVYNQAGGTVLASVSTAPTDYNNWHQISVTVTISGGQPALAFETTASAYDFLRVDDVSFVRIS